MGVHWGRSPSTADFSRLSTPAASTRRGLTGRPATMRSTACGMSTGSKPTWARLVGAPIASLRSKSPLAAEVRAALGPDDTVVVVATESVSGRERFVLDATTDDAFVASWQQLTGSLATSRRLPAAYREPE